MGHFPFSQWMTWCHWRFTGFKWEPLRGGMYVEFTNSLKREKYGREESSLQAFSRRKHKSAWKSNVTQQHSNIYLSWSWSSTSWSYQAILGSVYVQQHVRHYVKFKAAWHQNTSCHKICYVIFKWKPLLQIVHIHYYIHTPIHYLKTGQE